MRVLQINNVYGFGSTGKIVGSIHEYLLNNNVESYVIYARKTPKNVTMQNVYRIYSPLGTAMHAALAVIFDTHGLHSKFTTKKIIKKIEEINPDIIHMHVIHGFYLNYPMLFDYLKRSNKKVIWTLHDCWQHTGYCSHYTYNKCYEWVDDKCKNCRYRNVYPYRILSNAKNNYRIKEECYSDLDMTLVSCSKWLDNEISKSMLKDKKHLVINNSINLNNFYYEKTNILEEYGIKDKKIILAVSNVWTKQKGFDEYIKLASLLDNYWIIVMIGLTKKQINKLPSNIIGIQRVDVDQLRKLYSNSTVFVNLTLEENYPTVNLEAKACGLPIITYDTGGSKEMLSENDFVVKTYDIDEIIKILNNSTFKKQVVKINSNMNKEYLELYKELMK